MFCVVFFLVFFTIFIQHVPTQTQLYARASFFLSVIAIIGLFSVCLKFIFSFRMPVCMLPDINNTVKKSCLIFWSGF